MRTLFEVIEVIDDDRCILIVYNEDKEIIGLNWMQGLDSVDILIKFDNKGEVMFDVEFTAFYHWLKGDLNGKTEVARINQACWIWVARELELYL